MKVASTGNSHKGFSTVEILISLAILTLTITAVILLVFGNQSLTIDTQTNIEALAKAETELEEIRKKAVGNFADAITVSTYDWTPPGGLTYTASTSVFALTQCKKQATSTVSWRQGGRSFSVELTTLLSDIPGFLMLGGDCDVNPPTGGWNPPALFARDTLNPGKFSTLDALNRVVYLGSDDNNAKPFLFIADANLAVFNDSSNQPLIIPQSADDFANGFNADGKTIDPINDIDVFEDQATGKIYAFIAMASSTAQLAVVDVTDKNNPMLVATESLNGVDPMGSSPEGWRIYYTGAKVYITTRETSGPEFHIFDVTDPTDPDEIGSGTKLTGCEPPNGTTVNDFVVRDGIAFFAVKKEDCELMIYDVSDPETTPPAYLPGPSVDLPGDADGTSLFLIGNKLYFGREKNSGPEFYIFDVTNALSSMTDLPAFNTSDPAKEMGKDITGIQVAGPFAFLASYGDSSGGFKVWDITDPGTIKSVYLNFNFGNKLRALDYGDDFVYAAGESTPNFQILYSQP